MAATRSTKPKQQAKRTVTAEHKAAMAQGRKAAAAVGSYLEALEMNRPRRGRRVSVEQLTERLAEAQAAVENATGLTRLQAAQAVIDLQRRIEQESAPVIDLVALEDGFVEWASTYASNKGITYAAFREVGVPPAVLKAAGISRRT